LFWKQLVGNVPDFADAHEDSLMQDCRSASAVLWCILIPALISGCSNPADDVATAKVSAPKAEPNLAESMNPTAGVALKVSAGSSALKFGSESSKIQFVGSKVTGSHNGSFQSFQGTWYLVPEKPEASALTAQIDMDSTTTGAEKLTGHLKSPDFFDVAKFPKSTFESTGISSGSSDAKAKDATHTVTGNLTLHGVTKSIQFPAKLTVTPETATLNSEFSLNRKDFGVNYPGMANDLIRDEVVVKLAIQVPRKS
jgi:polyisoprenoid-binding protein YceI